MDIFVSLTEIGIFYSSKNPNVVALNLNTLYIIFLFACLGILVNILCCTINTSPCLLEKILHQAPGTPNKDSDFIDSHKKQIVAAQKVNKVQTLYLTHKNSGNFLLLRI